VVSFPPVNSVLRALDLLQALNRRPVSTIDDLYNQTSIPKPSIVRLLQTLQRRGLVRHAPQHGAYYLTSEVRALASGYHGEPRLIEAATPLLDDLTRRLKWPVAIAVPDSDAMVVRYSTIALSPLSLSHATIGLRRSFATRALGRAYLAFCEPDEQDVLTRLLQQSTDPEDASARDVPSFRRMLKTVRARGIATRDRRVGTVSNTLAVPIYEQSRVVATVGLTYFCSVMSQDAAIRQFRGEMVRLADDITERLDALGGRPHEASAMRLHSG
jgi:IclR family mhp operon transcriptional activator